MGKLKTAIVCIVALIAIAWAIVAAYQHHKRMSWRPPHKRLTSTEEALRKQFAAALADGRGITNGIIHPKEDDYLKQGADPAELKKGRQIGEAIVSGDFAAFERLKEMEKTEAEAFHAERTNWNHEQYNELAANEQMKIYAPSGFAQDIVISAGLRNYKNGLKAMDVALQMQESTGIPITFLGVLARRGNEAALQVFLSPTNYGVPFSTAIFTLKNAADNGDERAIDTLVAVFADKRNNPLWYITMDALAKATAAGNETAIDALIMLSTNKIPGIGRAAIQHLQVAADNNNAKAIEALKPLDAQGLVEPNAYETGNALREQMAQVLAEALTTTNTVEQLTAVSNAIPNTGGPDQEKCRQLGEAIVSGDATAMKWMLAFANPQRGSSRSNSVASSGTPWSDLPRNALGSLWVTFRVLDAAAAGGNTNALECISKSIQTAGLQGFGVESLGVLAGNGNEAAVEILIAPKKYGLLTSSTVPSLKNAANSGNEKAIAALAAVAADKKDRGDWYMAADGLQKAAASGNSVAIDALITLSATENSARDTAIEGLKKAAANQNAKAAEALQKLNAQ